MSNLIGRDMGARMPHVPPFHVREFPTPRGIPASNGGQRTLLQSAQARAHGEKTARDFGLEYLRAQKVIKPFSYTTDTQAAGTGGFAIAAGGQNTAVITINKEAAFELYKLSCTITIPALGIVCGRPAGTMSWRMKDDRKQMYMSNGQLPYLATTGTGVFPFVLPQPKFFGHSNTISIEMTNLDAVNQIFVHWELQGLNYYMREFENLTQVPDFAKLSVQEKEYFLASQKRYVEPYFYTFDGVGTGGAPAGFVRIAAANGQLVDQQINIRQEGDFQIFAYGSESDQQFSWIARESNTGRFLSNQPLVASASLGDGETPRLLPKPYWLDSNSQIFVTLTDLGGAINNDISLVFLGRIWYDTSSLNLTTGPDFWFNKYNAL